MSGNWNFHSTPWRVCGVMVVGKKLFETTCGSPPLGSAISYSTTLSTHVRSMCPRLVQLAAVACVWQKTTMLLQVVPPRMQPFAGRCCWCHTAMDGAAAAMVGGWWFVIIVVVVVVVFLHVAAGAARKDHRVVVVVVVCGRKSSSSNGASCGVVVV
jgi:hypothetical protein